MALDPITRVDVGGVTIHRIVEDVAPFVDFLTFFPDLSRETLAEHAHWLAPHCYDPGTGRIIIAFQSYLIVTPHHKILIDTCVGNDKERPTRPMWHKLKGERYMRNLKAAGVAPEEIDFVCCTHLHGDHTGWNTKLENGRWVPTFPKARYLFADREMAYWAERSKTQPETCPWIADSVLPIVEAQRADLVTSNHELSDIVRFLPTPGHTIDHFSVRLGRAAADAILTGDMVHSPLQLLFPDLGMMSDYDRAQGGRTRRALFEEIADQPTLCCTAHFPEPSMGHIKRKGDHYTFAPLGQ
ncbi:MAG: putative quorum-quenching lactonase YtnP [Pseudomonadota bacterium]